MLDLRFWPKNGDFGATAAGYFDARPAFLAQERRFRRDRSADSGPPAAIEVLSLPS
jgi:hypothetical protein